MKDYVQIGNHVWLVPECIVMKGVHIGDGSIIGTRTIVTKDITDNSLAVGVPAKVTKQGITWSREPLF